MINYGGFLNFSAMVKVSVLLIALCGLVPCASPSPYFLQQDGQSDQQQGTATTLKPGQVCDPASPTTCHPIDGVKAPHVTHAPDANYTKLARKQKLTGISVVSMMVGVDGKPYNVHVIRSIGKGLPPEFQAAAQSLDDSAVEAVQKYRFKPAIYKGKPLAVEVHIEVNFNR